MEELGQFVVLVMAVGLAFMMYDSYIVGNVETVKSTVDGREYVVQSLPDKQQAADLLAHIREKLVLLTIHMEKTYPDDERTIRMIKNFRPDALTEGTDNTKYTSYSVNKGEKIVFCLRARDGTKKLEDLNMMMFVAVHELGHIATLEVGHTKSFWDNFKWLLEEAVDIGIYQKQDFESKPREYCGMTVKSNVL